MTLVPSDPPMPDDPAPDVQQVVATRAEPGPADDPLIAFASRTRTVLGTAAGSFFSTVKRMLLLGVILALGAAWWAEQGSVLRGVGAALLVFIPAAVVAVLLAGQRAAAAIAVETWRQSGLVRHVLNFLLDRVVTGTDAADSTKAAAPAITDANSDPAAPVTPVAPASGTRIPLGEACVRLTKAVRRWKETAGGSSRLVARSQEWIGAIVEKLAMKEFQSQVGQGGVDVEKVRVTLTEKIDDVVAAQLRRKTRSATAGAVLADIAWAVLVAYCLRRLAGM